MTSLTPNRAHAPFRSCPCPFPIMPVPPSDRARVRARAPARKSTSLAEARPNVYCNLGATGAAGKKKNAEAQSRGAAEEERRRKIQRRGGNAKKNLQFQSLIQCLYFLRLFFFFFLPLRLRGSAALRFSSSLSLFPSFPLSRLIPCDAACE